jgi:DNA processing protein
LDTISGFWAGAIAVARRLDLDLVAARRGGWHELARCTVDDLLNLGVSYDLAVTWLRTPPLTTRGHAVTRACPEYPSALKLVPRAPPVLFTEGDLTCLARPALAVVGTRNCSPYGASSAHRVAVAAASSGWAVVSGLARGIDSHAHRGALAARGATVAVLGHGLLHTSPPANRALRDQIVRQGGLVLTTHPDEVPAARWTFPERNRWIAGLSRKLVVVEAPVRSGALITVEHWLDLGRDSELYAIPGPLDSPSWRGSASLLSMGAQPLLELDTFRVELGGPAPIPHPDWFSALISGAPLDEVAQIRGIPVTEVLREVVMLEMRGELVRLPGGRYAPARGVW